MNGDAKQRDDLRRQAAPTEVTRLVSYRISALSRHLAREGGSTYLQTIGLTLPEWRVISALGHRGELSVTEVASETFMDRGQASRTIDALNRAGLLRMRADVNDGRRLLYSLSRDGEARYAAGMPVALQRQERLLDGFSPAEVATFVRMLDAMIERLASAEAKEAAE